MPGVNRRVSLPDVSGIIRRQERCAPSLFFVDCLKIKAFQVFSIGMYKKRDPGDSACPNVSVS
jgi:hypothetical protein